MPMGLGLGIGLGSANAKDNWFAQGDFAGLSQPLDLALQFTQDRYMQNGTSSSLAALGFSSEHADDIYAPNLAGGYDKFGVDEFVRNELGLLVVRTVLNRLRDNSGLLPGWIKSGFTDSGTTEIAPDGSSVPVWDFGDGFMYQTTSPTSTPGQPYTNSVYIKSNMVTDIGMRVPGESALLNTISLTTSWQRYSASTLSATIGADYFMLDNRVSKGYGANPGLKISIFCPQHEFGAEATAPIINGAVATTRIGNLDIIAGLAMTPGVEFCVIAETLGVGSNNIRCFEANDGAGFERIGAAYSNGEMYSYVSSGGGHSATMLHGASTWPSGLLAQAVSCTTNYLKSGVVGQADVAADTSITYPATIDQIALGGTGFDAVQNAYIRIKEFHMRVNASPDAASYAEMLALATARKAVYV